MTDALKRFVAERKRKADPDDWGFTHPLSLKAAEFWIRAFCEELKDRAENRTGTVEECFYDAFQEFKRELLREK